MFFLVSHLPAAPEGFVELYDSQQFIPSRLGKAQLTTKEVPVRVERFQEI
jgi:hypothetical protein